MNEKKPDFTTTQINMVLIFFHGCVFGLSYMFIWEIPRMILTGSLLIQLSTIFVIIPMLIFLNYIGYKNIRGIWLQENKYRLSKHNVFSTKEVGGKN